MQEHILVKIGGDATGLNRTVSGIANSIGGMTKKLSGVGNFLGVAGGAAAFASFARGATEYVDNINDAAESTSLGTTVLQEYYHAMSMAGVSTEKTRAALEKMTRTLGEARSGNAAAAKTFEKLGVDIKGLSSEQVLDAVREKINAIEDPAQRAAAAVDVFGKSGARMLEGLRDFEKLREGASILSPEDLENLGRFGDTVERLGTQSKVGFGMMISWAMDAGNKVREALAFNVGGNKTDLGRFLMPAAKTSAELVDNMKDFAVSTEMSSEAADKLAEDAAKLYEHLKSIRADAAFEKMTDAGKLKELEGRYAVLIRLSKTLKETSKAGMENQIEREKLKLKIEEQQAAMAEKALKAKQAAANIREDLRTALKDRASFTVAELAALGEDGTRLTPAARAKRDAAQRILQTEFLAREAGLQNDPKGKAKLTNQALKMRAALGDVLSSSEADPLALQKLTKEHVDIARQLLEKAGGAGLIVQPKMAR